MDEPIAFGNGQLNKVQWATFVCAGDLHFANCAIGSGDLYVLNCCTTRAVLYDKGKFAFAWNANFDCAGSHLYRLGVFNTVVLLCSVAHFGTANNCELAVDIVFGTNACFEVTNCKCVGNHFQNWRLTNVALAIAITVGVVSIVYSRIGVFASCFVPVTFHVVGPLFFACVGVDNILAYVTNKVVVRVEVRSKRLLHVCVDTCCSVPVLFRCGCPLLRVGVSVLATFVSTCVAKTIVVFINVRRLVALYVVTTSGCVPVTCLVGSPLVSKCVSATYIATCIA